MKLEETRNAVNSILRVRELHVPKNAFSKTRPIAKRSSVYPHEQKTLLGSFRAPISKRRGARINGEQFYKIIYKGSIIPEEILNSKEYQLLQMSSFLENMHHVVSKFYLGGQRSEESLNLLCSWLLSIHPFSQYPESMIKELIPRFKLERFSSEYCRLIFKY